MKTFCYLSSYKTIKSDFTEDIEQQKNAIENYCYENNIQSDRVFIENFDCNDTSKPILLNIIHDYYDVIKKIIVQNPGVISRNKDFQYWILEELKRLGVEIIFLNDEGEIENKNILKKTLEIKDKVKSIPSLPHVITKVMEVIQDKDSSAFALAKVISGDLGLTSKVLKIVNSSFYGFEKQITSIRQAIVVLGFTTIKGIVLSAGIFKMFSPKKNNIFDYELFWQHSILTALGAKYLVKNIETNNEDDIFSIAFLHDLGKIILAQYDYENYLTIYNELEQEYDYKIKFKIEEDACGINHCEIAYSVLKGWNLPSVFHEVCLYHHTPQLSNDYEFACTIVYITDIMVNNILHGKIFDTDDFEEDTLIKFSITEDILNNLHVYLLEQADSVKDITGFFN